MIFEKSQKPGKAPGDWKNGNITTIFKMDKKEDSGDYCPASLISVPEKIVEQILLEVLRKHMDREVIQDNFSKCTSALKMRDGPCLL